MAAACVAEVDGLAETCVHARATLRSECLASVSCGKEMPVNVGKMELTRKSMEDTQMFTSSPGSQTRSETAGNKAGARL
jgi:hypothetical protein